MKATVRGQYLGCENRPSKDRTTVYTDAKLLVDNSEVVRVSVPQEKILDVAQLASTCEVEFSVEVRAFGNERGGFLRVSLVDVVA